MKRTHRWISSLLAATSAIGCSLNTEGADSKVQSLTVEGVSANVSVQNDWGSGYCADVMIDNATSSSINDWQVTLALGDNSIGNLWNGSYSGSKVGPVAHNSTVAGGSSVSFGFCASGSDRPTIAGLSFEGGGGGPTATCSDGVQNQGETGVDCGGPCGPCDDGGGDCSSALTWVDNDWRIQYAVGDYAEYAGQYYRAAVAIDYPNGSCTPDAPASWCAHWFTPVSSCDGDPPPDPSCNDGIQNQGETGVDCGGPCTACAPDPSCNDGIQNQGETGIDCGGPCTACAPDPSCNDGIQNQGETGVDCGGPCGPCDDGGEPTCDGYATRYWDCCMAHCSWEGNVPMSVEPMAVCSADDQPLSNPSGSACSGGDGYTCHSFAPFAVSSTLSFGYAATSDGDVCGRCYEIEFTGQGHYGYNQGAANLAGKRMIVQATNIGYDVGGGQFDLLIPGGGVGLFDACSSQWDVSSSELGATYGGFLTACQQQGGSYDQIKTCVRNRCDSVFGTRGLTELQEGCHWFVDWFEAADNPNLKYREVACPAELTGESGMDRSSLGDIDLSCTQ